MRLRHLLLGLLATGAIAGCGSEDEGAARYPEQARTEFVEACDAQPNAARSVCECALEELERTMPYEEFKAADEAIREGEEADAASAEKLTASVEACVEER